ncbi:3-isopropylmalate dehydrogenase [Trichoderma citrinoviride]|uniref:3-isopropylmalate dehydrogenase n=1 Tax=Trichoderma citrinoviride TaxID=58853 RepID=A0A2T4BAH0_9HYPO|nr:3-isopropylmalate dehydrogenase [Trichoderma citrinoviride]PTB66324.1 3-isopropylmalate dehydrogenase [Trichoderma citrinoviride]
MAEHNIVVFAGDHAGPEVIAEAVKVLKAIEQHSPSAGKFNLKDHLLGGCSIDATGTPLTDEALAAANAADAVLLGAIGGPKWGTGAVRPEQGLLRLRKEMGTYGNLRPCFFASDALVDSSPLKADVCRGTDFVIVRELTGGIYFGERKEDDDGSGRAWDTEPYSRGEVERVARLAGFLARGRGEKRVWSLDKANVLATSRLWRKVMTETFAREFPDLTVEHQLIDSAAMIMVKNPRGLNGVVVTSNFMKRMGENEKTDGDGAISGSAPDISGKGIVNPIGTILSVAMMLRYSLNLPNEAKAVEEAVKRAIDGGLRTKDMGGSSGTKEAGDAIVEELVKVLKA